MADKRTCETQGKRANMPRLPDNWDHQGNSSGKQTGAVRPTKDAYQGERGRGSRK